MKIDDNWVKAAIFGGSILGGGGGGSIKEGERLGKLALEFGNPIVLSLDQLPEDAFVLTLSAVGAPSAVDQCVTPLDYVKVVSLMMEHFEHKIDGLMTNEVGGLSVINGLIQSVILDIPLIDAACNGRAHPTGAMGSMGLSMKSDFISYQAAVGGSKEKHKHIEIFARGDLLSTSKIIRKAAEEAGGLVAVARNPVPVKYVKENGAVGAITQAVRVGEAYLRAKEPEEKIKNVVEVLGGDVVGEGDVLSVELKNQGGFDVGRVMMSDFELTFWNEYMTLETDGKRVATFPDLIMTMDKQTAYPLTSADVKKGQDLVIISVPHEKLNLGAGMRDIRLFYDVEKAIGKEIVKYVFKEVEENAFKGNNASV